MRRIYTVLFLILSIQILRAQELAVTGQVTSADDGYPLPGVSVIIKGTSSGTSTDSDGIYHISVQPDQTLVFSSIGFVGHEETVDGRGLIDVALSTDSMMLEEVVAIGYGVVKKSDLTGSVSSVKGD